MEQKMIDAIDTRSRYYDNINISEYHRNIPALSSSLLRKGLITLAHLQAAKDRPEEKQLSLGSVIHSLLLEDGELSKEMEIKKDGRTKEGRTQQEQADKENFYLISPRDLEIGMNVYTATKTNPNILRIKDIPKEVSGIAVDPIGILLKIRPDAIDHERNIIYDVKSVSTGMSERQLGMLVMKNGWLIQAAFYIYVNKLITNKDYEFKHLFVETGAPYGVRLRSIATADIEKITQDVIVPFLPKYKQALESGVYPCFDESDAITKIPGFVYSDDFEQDGDLDHGF